MQPPTQEQMNALHQQIESLVIPLGFIAISRCKFLKNGNLYDLSAADLNQIERIEKEGLCIVPIEGIS